MFTWTQSVTPWDGLGFGAACLKLPSGRLIIGGASGDGTSSILYSDDGGSSWTPVSTPLDAGGINGLAYSVGLDRIVAVGNQSGMGPTTAAHSDDGGETWVDDGDPFGGALFGQCVVRDGADGMFVAGCSSLGAVAFTSSDGITWTGQTTPLDGDGISAGLLSGICESSILGEWVAVGRDSTNTYTGITSPDASTWSLATGPFDGFGTGAGGIGRSITEDTTNSVLIAAGSGGVSSPSVLATSPDFSTWTPRSSPGDGSDGQIVGARAGAVLAGTNSGSVGILESSDGGATWATDTSPTIPATYGLAFIDDVHALVATFDPGAELIIAALGVSGTVAPSAPTLDSATGALAAVQLAWTPGSDGGSPITGYTIYRGLSSGAETPLATVGVTTTYRDADVTVGVTYFYKVTAINAVGESSLSNEESAEPLPFIPILARVAYGSEALATTPDFTDLIGEAGVGIQAVRIRRGRQYLTDRIEAGVASIDFTDQEGTLDPTNSLGPFYPMDPNCPAQIWLLNPVTGNYLQIFGGLVQASPTTIRSDDAAVNRGTISLVDLFSLLAIKEVPPGLDFDSSDSGSSTPNTSGDTTYAATDVQSRMLAILADAQIPSDLYTVFSGNVNLQFTIYSPGYKILAALQDCADAEFPGVANWYVDKTGLLTFHGRLARFNTGVDNPYGIHTWKCGDAQAAASDTGKAVIALNGLTIDRDVTKIINNAIAYPQGISNADLAGQLVVDPTQAGDGFKKYGPRSWSAPNLLTAGGISDGNGANDETKLYAQFYIDNLAEAQTRVQAITFNELDPSHPNAEAQWNLICNVEINDLIEITTTHPGAGGLLADSYFVEGITYTITNDGGLVPHVSMTLDLSPQAYFTTEPWDNE